MKTKAFTVVLFLLIAGSIYAQEKEIRFAFELNGGAALSTSKMEGFATQTGVGFEALFHYRFLPQLGAYAGWGWNTLPAKHSFAGDDVCFEETGYILGLNFSHPIHGLGLSYYVRAAGLYNHIETENADGNIINDTGHGLGFQLAGGVEIPLNSKWSLTPGIKFNSLDRKTDYKGSPLKLHYQYLSIRIGIVRKF